MSAQARSDLFPPKHGASFRSTSGKAPPPSAAPRLYSPAASCASKFVQIPLARLRHLGASPEQHRPVVRCFSGKSLSPVAKPSHKKITRFVVIGGPFRI